MSETISIGPFTYRCGPVKTVNGLPSRLWRMEYGGQLLAEKWRVSVSEKDALGITASELASFFADERADFIADARKRSAPDRVDLIDSETGDAVAAFNSYDVCGMTPGLIDDRSRYWIRSSNKRYSRDVTLSEFAQIAAQCMAPPNAWMADLLPDEVLTQDSENWRAPLHWELRHLIGEGSFTGISGAKAAELVGVTPQNFRKYTAQVGAKTRQSMSFAMWHLLLQKLEVKRA